MRKKLEKLLADIRALRGREVCSHPLWLTAYDFDGKNDVFVMIKSTDCFCLI